MAAILVFSSPGETLIGGHLVTLTTGNTQRLAREIGTQIHQSIQAIRPQHAYPLDYQDRLVRAQDELSRHQQPAIQRLDQAALADPVWFVGYPIWFGHLPRPMVTFFHQTDSCPQVILPFLTHEGSGAAHSLTELQTLCPTVHVMPGLIVRGTRVDRSQRAVDVWLAQYYQGLRADIVKGDF